MKKIYGNQQLLGKAIDRNPTNDGTPSKLHLNYIRHSGGEDVVVITHYLLFDASDVDLKDVEELTAFNFKLVKVFKLKFLFKKSYSMRISTMKRMTSWALDIFLKNSRVDENQETLN